MDHASSLNEFYNCIEWLTHLIRARFTKKDLKPSIKGVHRKLTKKLMSSLPPFVCISLNPLRTHMTVYFG